MATLQDALRDSMGKLGFSSEDVSLNTGPTTNQDEKKPEPCYHHTAAISPGNEAHAPYNFVPLNDSLVSIDEIPDFSRFDPALNTGYIDLTITSEQDIYIRDCTPLREYQQNKNAKSRFSFFSPAGRTLIPGSSLRGMLRSLLEIVTWGRFDNYSDKRLYFRDFADSSSLAEEYKERMPASRSQGQPPRYAMHAGYLQRKGYGFEIIPAEVIKEQYFRRIKTKDAITMLSGKWKNNTHHFLNDGTCLVISGSMQGKTHDWIIHPPNLKVTPIPLLETDVDDYLNDTNRKSKNLLDQLKSHKLMPCFYVQWGPNRVSFGNTVMFRLAYKKSIRDHVPRFLQQAVGHDMVDKVFGTVRGNVAVASRVFVEDAGLQGELKVANERPHIGPVLSSPKPTSFQLYLVQNSARRKSLKHYNSDDTQIRGYKMYWHRRAEVDADEIRFDKNKLKDFISKHSIALSDDWRQRLESGRITVEEYNRINDPTLLQVLLDFFSTDANFQHPLFVPLPAGRTFIGRIRFTNLTDIELGALLFVLDLPQGCRHKIGMGKPLGLGTIEISANLVLSNRQERYNRLEAEWSKTALEAAAPPDQFIKKFNDYIIKHLPDDEIENVKGDLWATERLQQLKKMLSLPAQLDHAWQRKTSYMSLHDFRERKVLPMADSV